MDDDEARSRIKEIAAHCKTLLGTEDDDLIEGEMPRLTAILRWSLRYRH